MTETRLVSQYTIDRLFEIDYLTELTKMNQIKIT